MTENTSYIVCKIKSRLISLQYFGAVSSIHLTEVGDLVSDARDVVPVPFVAPTSNLKVKNISSNFILKLVV